MRSIRREDAQSLSCMGHGVMTRSPVNVLSLFGHQKTRSMRFCSTQGRTRTQSTRANSLPNNHTTFTISTLHSRDFSALMLKWNADNHQHVHRITRYMFLQSDLPSCTSFSLHYDWSLFGLLLVLVTSVDRSVSESELEVCEVAVDSPSPRGPSCGKKLESGLSLCCVRYGWWASELVCRPK